MLTLFASRPRLCDMLSPSCTTFASRARQCAQARSVAFACPRAKGNREVLQEKCGRHGQNSRKTPLLIASAGTSKSGGGVDLLGLYPGHPSPRFEHELWLQLSVATGRGTCSQHYSGPSHTEQRGTLFFGIRSILAPKHEQIDILAARNNRR